MSFRYRLFVACNLLLLVATAFGSRKDAESAALIARAQHLSDVRAEGAPTFRMKVDLRVVNNNGLAEEGTYTEVWVSRTQWRRETGLGNFRRTQVAVGRKLWTLDSATEAPDWINDIRAISDLGRFQPNAWKTSNVLDRDIGGVMARCIETKSAPVLSKLALCFDKAKGTLLTETSWVKSGTRIVDRTCFYNDYRTFGDHLVARSYKCEEQNQVRIEAKIAELIPEREAAPALFAAPKGAKESPHCLGPVQPPSVIHEVEPAPTGISSAHNSVAMSILVGTDGIPRNMRIVSSVNPGFDQAAVEAMRQWRFKTARCDGEPIEVEIVVQMNLP